MWSRDHDTCRMKYDLETHSHVRSAVNDATKIDNRTTLYPTKVLELK